MRRGTLLAIVVLLAIGQDATLLCPDWCKSDSRPAAECHDLSLRGTLCKMAGDASCERVPDSFAVIVNEDARRVSAPGVSSVAVVSRHATPAMATGVHRVRAPGRAPAVESRPLVRTLRI